VEDGGDGAEINKKENWRMRWVGLSWLVGWWGWCGMVTEELVK
jgi:hypothetical protein